MNLIKDMKDSIEEGKQEFESRENDFKKSR